MVKGIGNDEVTDLIEFGNMKHNLPIVPVFNDTPPGGLIEEVALRVLVELPDWEIHIIGTATLIGAHLALTAKHVIEASLRWFKAVKDTTGKTELAGGSLQLLQILPGPVYRFWSVTNAWMTSSDIAILHLNLDRTSEADVAIKWKSLPLRATPPPSGQKIVAFGYRESKVQVTKGPNGQAHIDINDKPTTSAGVVGQIFPARRDSGMLNFPCFEVHAQFAHGMSGGLVVDEDGWLCGLVCAGTNFNDPSAPPLSYAATLWPMLTTEISADRGDSYPRGVRYPVIDLALDNIIHMSHLEDLDPALFPGRTLPRR
jgi:Trypsin-like peptidase domain